MGSDIFRELNMDDFAPSDVIYSMREQMTPSDDVVDSLLAKIAACETSPEFADNTVKFEPVSIPTSAVETAAKSASRTAGRKPLSRKSLIGIASVAAACVIMLTSAVAIMGTGDSSEVDNLIDKIVPDGVVTNPTDSGDVTDSGDAITDSKDGADATDSKDGKDSEVTESDSKDKGKTDASADSKSDSKSNKGTTNKNTSRDDGGSAAPSPGNNSNTSVNKTGSGDVTFNREILAEESVSHLTISGSNYVVESSASPVTTTEIKSISLEIPETTTTNEAVVDAHVKKIQNVSTDLMVAVDVDGFKDTLIYTNESYSPSTLGEFVSDAGLDANASYSKSVYCKGDNIGYSSYHKFSVSNIKDYVDKYILSNTSAKIGSHSAYSNADTHVTFKSNSNPT